MSAVFLASYQVCSRSEESSGPIYKYRQPERTVLVVAEKPELIGIVIEANVELAAGESVEVTQQRQLEPGRKVYGARKA
jgi:hypothetical protein